MYQAFVTAWGNTTPIAFDNEKFTPPIGAPWVRLSVRHQVSNQETLGGPGVNRVFMREGTIYINIFAPEDAGQLILDTLAQQAREVFEAVTLPGVIWTTDAVVREIGPDEGWNQTNVEATFFYDEVK